MCNCLLCSEALRRFYRTAGMSRCSDGASTSLVPRAFGRKIPWCTKLAYGNGIERYINDTSGLGIDAAVSSLQNPHIQALPVVGTYGALQHFWLERLRSSANLQLVQVQNTVAEPGATYHQGNYTGGNLIWNPFGSLTVGGEFLYGWRVNEDKAHRLMRRESSSAPSTTSCERD